MLRKTTAAVVLAGALALGTASATSLGTFNDITFAASDVGLLDCEVAETTDILNLVPDLPAVGEAVSTVEGITSFAVDTLDVSGLVAGLEALPTDCVTGTVLNLYLVDGNGDVLEIVPVDPDDDTADFSQVSLNGLFDLTQIAEVRMLLEAAEPVV